MSLQRFLRHANWGQTLGVSCALYVICSPFMFLRAQEILPAEPASQHLWLDKFEGSWKTVTKAQMSPDQPESTMEGTIESKRLGAFWLVNEMTSEIDGVRVIGRQTIGYDRDKGKYIGTWIDNMTDYMWNYEGNVDETGMILSLEATGPDMTQPGKMALYRDRYEFLSKDEIRITSSAQDADGNWIDFMTGVGKRSK